MITRKAKTLTRKKLKLLTRTKRKLKKLQRPPEGPLRDGTVDGADEHVAVLDLVP